MQAEEVRKQLYSIEHLIKQMEEKMDKHGTNSNQLEIAKSKYSRIIVLLKLLICLCYEYLYISFIVL